MNTNCTCGKSATASCGQCKKISYCSKDCQIADWPAHKIFCRDDATLKIKLAKLTEIIKKKYNVGSRKGFIIKFDESVAVFTRETMHLAHVHKCETDRGLVILIDTMIDIAAEGAPCKIFTDREFAENSKPVESFIIEL